MIRRPPRSTLFPYTRSSDLKVDHLRGLKENVIIGKLIPASTGLRHYRTLEIFSTVPVPEKEDLLAVGAETEEDLTAS